MKLRAPRLRAVGAGVAAMALHAAGQAASPPPLQDFGTGDGAYYTTVGGQQVDPYFVNKGFIIAMQAGAPLQAEFLLWLRWLLPRQRSDGGFDRYCRREGQGWNSCMKADADDSMAATTMQMLTLALQKRWVPDEQRAATRRAIDRASGLLASLLNTRTQIYRVFADAEVYYLMDNAEVYEGLRAVGAAASANQLAAAIRRQFLNGTQWKPAIPEYTAPQFYPHTLASTYLWSTSVLPREESAAMAAQWLAQHGNTWLSRSGDRFAWGLVAWQIHRDAPLQAACWRASLRPFDPAIGWTVLDALVDQSLASRHISRQCALAAMPAPRPTAAP
ncbi:hypothetical protein GCM10027082_32790 [Comamonas humi]